MFEHDFRIESMEREPESGCWLATVSCKLGLLGLTEKHYRFILINDTWVDVETMSNLYRYDFLNQPLDNMWKYKMQIEAKSKEHK